MNIKERIKETAKLADNLENIEASLVELNANMFEFCIELDIDIITQISITNEGATRKKYCYQSEDIGSIWFKSQGDMLRHLAEHLDDL